MVPVWEVLEFNWLRQQAPSFDRNRNALRAAVVCGTGVLAYGVPNFGLFVSLIGSRYLELARCNLFFFFEELRDNFVRRIIMNTSP